MKAAFSLIALIATIGLAHAGGFGGPPPSPMAHLDALVVALPADCDPQLRHFLERQSYAKALDWLQVRVESDAG